MEVVPYLALGATIGGVVVGVRADAPPELLLVGVVALLGAWFAQGSARAVLAILACAAIGATMSTRAAAGLRTSALTPAIETRSQVALEGVLTSDPDGGPYSAAALVRVQAGDGTHRTVLADASGDDGMRLRVLQAGDRVVLAGRLEPLGSGGFDARARDRHAVARLEHAELQALAPPTGFVAFADAVRNVVLRGTRALPPTQRALVAGFLLGDTRGVPDDVVADYRASGLSHLLAVSGENVAFILALAGPLLRRLRLGPRTLVALSAVLVFAAMTRFEPSVLRASAMAVVALLAAFAGRPAARGRVLAYAVIVLLLADPFLVRSVGFWLSCGASAGIAFLEPPIARRLRGPRFVRDALAVSLAAQAGVMPVLLLAFGSFPLVTPLSNLVAAPAADVLGTYGFVASAVAGCVPALGPLLQWPNALLVGWVNAVAHASAAVPLVLGTRGALAAICLASVAASLACLRARRPVPDVAHR